MHKTKKSQLGMTLVELLIASVILMLVLTMMATSYINFSASKRKILLSSETYNETRFLLERIAREVQNGTIDYQGYWRENIKNETAAQWAFQTNTGADPKVYEGSNPKGADLDTTNNGGFALNAIKNCNDPNDTNEANDKNSNEERLDILLNYRYQFIYPGNKENNGGGDNDGNTETLNQVHLNCLNDAYNELDGYNIYDDEPAYGHGPRAFDQGTAAYDSTINTVKASDMNWDWDLTTLNPVEDNNPPLLLVKENESGTKYTRTAIRYDKNKIKLMRFIAEDNMDNDSPPDGIPDKWMCETDFECGPDGSTSFNGTYTWSQKEENANAGGNANIGEDNGIGTITDSDLHWKDITPEKIRITHFDFILSPVKDPHRAFYESDKIQKPQITLIIEAEAKKSAMKGIKGEAPSIRLQTTVTPRIWDLIEVDN